MIKKAHQDIIIIGGGMAGLTQAVMLAREGLNVTVIETQDPEVIREQRRDGRASALAYGSQQILDNIGGWDAIADHAQPMWDIRITNQDSPWFLHYAHDLVGDMPMGYVVPNPIIIDALFSQLESLPNLHYCAPMRYTDICYTQDKVEVSLADGNILSAQLLIGADGRFSKVREGAGIETKVIDYQQVGIVCTVAHEKDHEGIAQERFLPAGPFAILPLHGGFQSSLVWTEKKHLASLYLQMDPMMLTREISHRFGHYLGKISVASQCYSYPISAMSVDRITGSRMALVGDAAHGIHPIAGQGLNLGFRDIAALSKLIAEAYASGQDIGSSELLTRYAKARKTDITLMIAITDGLNRLFSNNNKAVSAVRGMGLKAVDTIPSLKKLFMRHAMGQVAE